jgi:4-oxalomesaconate hydratase
MTLDRVKQARHEEAQRAADVLGGRLVVFDAGDYPMRLTDAHFERMVDLYREIRPEFVLTHSLEDPYNRDHPEVARFAQETRISAQAHGFKPQTKPIGAPPVFLFEPHQTEQCNWKPQVFLPIDDVWDPKRKAMECMAAQEHLWDYYTRVALQRGAQAARNSDMKVTYAEAYQRVFPQVSEALA